MLFSALINVLACLPVTNKRTEAVPTRENPNLLVGFQNDTFLCIVPTTKIKESSPPYRKHPTLHLSPRPPLLQVLAGDVRGRDLRLRHGPRHRPPDQADLAPHPQHQRPGQVGHPDRDGHQDQPRGEELHVVVGQHSRAGGKSFVREDEAGGGWQLQGAGGWREKGGC